MAMLACSHILRNFCDLVVILFFRRSKFNSGVKLDNNSIELTFPFQLTNFSLFENFIIEFFKTTLV